MKKPIIPKSPDQLPQQRIVAVANLQDRPAPFDAAVGWASKPKGLRLPNGPSNPAYLGQVEWSWSPMNSRIDAYYLSRSRMHWILWIYFFDDYEGVWEWVAVGNVPRKQASQKQAAVHLLVDYWRLEKVESELDHCHQINQADFLSVSEWRTIARLVWQAEIGD
jgi:hypothetical protein